jgi:vesicle coat complex subunit
MKRKLIEIYCKDFYDYLEIKISKEMFESVEKMFDEFILNKESKGLENDIDLFFNEMDLDIECELESWD